jgi:hypothetical protein
VRSCEPANRWWIGLGRVIMVACLVRPLPLTDHAFSHLITPVVVTTGRLACSPSAWSSCLMTIPSWWVEIACDESGFSGTNLLDPASPAITHASTDLAVPEAAEVVAVLRSRLRRLIEYKSSQLLRPGQRPALRRRTGFLTAFVDLTRTKRVRLIDHDAIDRFFATMPADLPALREVTPARVEEVMVRLLDADPAFPPPLEPLVPALAETLLFWSAGERSVAVVHDEQSALTRGRVARLGTFLAEAVSPAPPPLRSFLQVDSRDDPRVQVADLLAGIARRRTPQLNELLTPHLQAGADRKSPRRECRRRRRTS